MIEITDQGRALLDAEDIGDVASAAKNNLVSPSEVQAALIILLDKLKADKSLYTEATTLAKEAIESGDETKKIEALEKIEEAKTPAKDRQRAELEKQRDNILAKLAALDEAVKI